MRTTLTIDDNIASELKAMAQEAGISYKQIVNDALRAGVKSLKQPPRAEQYKLEPVALGEPRPGYNLDKALELAEHLEDEEIATKLDLQK